MVFQLYYKKEEEHSIYVDIGKSLTLVIIYPPQKGFWLADLISAARTHKFIFFPWTAIELTRDAPQWKLGNYHCHGDKKKGVARKLSATMHHNVSMRHVLIHKKHNYKCSEESRI